MAVVDEQEILRMRKASGSVESDDPLVSFLYLLARDGLPVGQIETLIDQTQPPGVKHIFTNGWLATWAMDAAARLR